MKLASADVPNADKNAPVIAVTVFANRINLKTADCVIKIVTPVILAGTVFARNPNLLSIVRRIAEISPQIAGTVFVPKETEKIVFPAKPTAADV